VVASPSRRAAWRPESSCLNPLHCGAVVASPSRRAAWRPESSCLNPLHCGAVVASRFSARTRVFSSSLNPLHCGAVVASIGGALAPETGGLSSQSPSLRGSGRFRKNPWLFFGCRHPVSIPFIAGQWSLRFPGSNTSKTLRSFNPLHCGAVVASSG